MSSARPYAHGIKLEMGEWDHPRGWGSHSPIPVGFTHTHTHTSIYYSINICYTQLCTNIQVGPKGLGQNQTKVWALISKHSQNPSKITEHAHLIFTCACTCKIHVSPKSSCITWPKSSCLKKTFHFFLKEEVS